MEEKEEEEKPKAVVVGGSVAGLSCAHALISAGWRVLVLEKTPDPPSGSPTGAGLGLEPQSLSFLSSWLPSPELLRESTLPMAVDLVCIILYILYVLTPSPLTTMSNSTLDFIF